MDPHEQDEDVTGIIRALHARLDALEASFFSKVTDAAKKAASAVANTVKNAVKSTPRDNMKPSGVVNHLLDTFPGIKIYPAKVKGDIRTFIIIHNNTEFYLALRFFDSTKAWSDWSFWKGMQIHEWDEDHTPKDVDLRSLKIDKYVHSYKDVDDYIREHAP